VGLDLLPWPKVDFAKFGPVERKDLSRIKKISGANLHRNWVMIPTSPTTTRPTSPSWKPSACHQQGEREERRQGDHAGLRDQGRGGALKKFPEFNASWTATPGLQAVLPHRLCRRHAQRPGGAGARRRQEGHLADQRGNGELAKKARDGKLGAADMQGGCFSISRWAALAARTSRPSSTRRKWPSWACPRAR
jgi:pyruvate dehydrogenase E2 component (dihydrolipoamide acetyltransferase)